MSPKSVDAVERSVDSMQNIYAVVIALAISQAIEGLLKDLLKQQGGMNTFDFDQLFLRIPAFVAFSFTVVPFWHGMNRHLDRCYIEKDGRVVRHALAFDFTMFFVEAILLFAAAWLLKSGIGSFAALGLLLCIDMLWGRISHHIHFRGEPKSHVVKWSTINLIAIGLALLVIFIPAGARLWVLMGVAIARGAVDNFLCRDFYFPKEAS